MVNSFIVFKLLMWYELRIRRNTDSSYINVTPIYMWKYKCNKNTYWNVSMFFFSLWYWFFSIGIMVHLTTETFTLFTIPHWRSHCVLYMGLHSCGFSFFLSYMINEADLMDEWISVLEMSYRTGQRSVSIFSNVSRLSHSSVVTSWEKFKLTCHSSLSWF